MTHPPSAARKQVQVKNCRNITAVPSVRQDFLQIQESTPAGPAGLLPDTRPAYRALKIKSKKIPAREGRRRRISNIGTVPASYDPLRAAFYVSWDAASFAVLIEILRVGERDVVAEKLKCFVEDLGHAR